jgi:hypothetical protein
MPGMRGLCSDGKAYTETVSTPAERLFRMVATEYNSIHIACKVYLSPNFLNHQRQFTMLCYVNRLPYRRITKRFFLIDPPKS